jgi:hypothetical protein
MHHKIDSLRGPNPLDSSSAKAIFYIFHVLPEWLAILVLYSVDVRKTFGTALFGDWRWRDETPKEKQKRLARRAKREEKKKGILMGDTKKGNDDPVERKDNLGQDEVVTLNV